ncbi:MAG TPA: hypothetical protein VEA18_00295 [Candidatus Kapabacteria bacterium]|nr:hypothetical protein [Candidatus Kapabacteria bacterium]
MFLIVFSGVGAIILFFLWELLLILWRIFGKHPRNLLLAFILFAVWPSCQ